MFAVGIYLQYLYFLPKFYYMRINNNNNDNNNNNNNNNNKMKVKLP